MGNAGGLPVIVDRFASEKRAHRRLTTSDNVTVLTGNGAFPYRVINMSASGAMLVGGPILEIGQQVNLAITLHDASLVELAALITRHDSIGGRIAQAISFKHCSDATEDAIQEAMLHWLERAHGLRAPHVLIIGRSTSTIDSLEPTLIELGRSVISATTALDAILHLQTWDELGTVLVEGALGGTTADDLLNYLEAEFPHVRRIFLGREDDDPRPPSAHATLLPPWTLRGLVEALCI